MKRWIAFLLSVVMVLSLMPMAVMAEEAQEQERLPMNTLYVGTVNALETPQGDGWSYDASTSTLTLNNCTLTESMLHVETYQDEEGNVYYDRRDSMIYFDGELTIELIGTNSVERVVENAPGDYTSYYAICGSLDIPDGWDMPAALKFTGTGNLTVGLAVTADYLSEDGYSMNDAWEYFEFSSGIGVWGGVDLSGLYGGGWMDIYGGVYGVQAPYIVRAFANYPTFGDNCIVTAYQDVEGTIENENGYNWNNNDAWRMKVVTGNAILKDNGQLILMEADSASGNGWTWENKVLTLSEGTEVKAVDFRSGLGSAKLVLTGDVTLDGTDLGIDSDWNDISAIETHCDLEIDAGEHTLTFTGYTGGIKSYLSDVLISGGTIADNGEGYIEVKGADLTVQDATLGLSYGINLSSSYDADWNDVPAGDLLIKDAVVSMEAGISSDSGLTVMGSEVTVTDIYGGEFVVLQDSTVTVNSYGLAVNTGGRVTVDNCNLDIYGEGGAIGYSYYQYTWDEEGTIPDASWIQLLNMDITQPEGCTVSVSEEVEENYTKYTVQVVDGNGNAATTMKATAAGNEHEHSYTQGVCSCGKKQTFTITWKNDDGTILEVDTVEYGDHPEYNGPTPTKTGVGYDYTFYAWSNGTQYTNVENVVVTQDWTYTAGYNKTAHKHDLILMDGDVELARKEMEYSASIVKKNLYDYAGYPTKDCYTLSGWVREDGTGIASYIYMPDNDLVLYAVWNGPNHTWVAADCESPKTCSVCGETEDEPLGHSWVEATCEAPKTCSVCGLTEGEALSDHNYVNGVCTCGAKQTFTITWKNDDGTVLEVDTVEYGDHPEYNGPTPTKTGEGYDYTFYAWSNGTQYTNVENVIVTQDWTYTAGYNQTAHVRYLIFMDSDGVTEISRYEVYYGKSISGITTSWLTATAGTPKKDCYTLTGWERPEGLGSSYTVPDYDPVYVAIWDGPNHTWEGEETRTCSHCGVIEGGALPEHTHIYLEGVCSCGKKLTFTITWKNWDGTVLETDTVEYGVKPEYNGPTPTKEVTGQTCTFAGWGTVNKATADKTYTATFYQSANKYNVILMDGDTELGRHELAYDAIVSESSLPEYAGNPTKPCCTISGWQYADGTAFSSTRMTAEDMVLYIVWDGPNHTWAEATCDAPKTCTSCGLTEGEALGHSYTEGVCATCGGKQTFTVTWTNWDGTVLEVDTVEYGQIPEYNGETPIKTDVGYDYTFSCWYKGNYPATFEAVTADMTFKAYYASVVHKHDLIFMSGDVELARKELDYNKYVYQSNLNSWAGNSFGKDCCTLSGWAYADGTAAGAFWMPDEDMVLYAVWDGPNHTFADGVCSVCGLTEGMPEHTHLYVEGVCACGKIQTFTVTWTNWDGTVLEVDTVEYGQIPEYNGETPVKTGVGNVYTFSCWYQNNSPAKFEGATADCTYKAYFTGVANKHDIVFMDGETELARKELYYNKYVYTSAATLNGYAGYPTKDCYTLSGWAYADGTLVTSNFYMPDEDVVMYAVWDGPNHTWVDATCAAPKTCSVCGLTEGEALEHTYTEGVCSGCGAIQTFTVTWANWDGTVLETDTVEYGTVPTYDGETPTRPNVGYDFKFYGWALSASGAEVTPGAVTKDVTYYAKYTSTVHNHDLIFLDDDGVTELGRYETYYSKGISGSWLTTAAGNPTKACCILTGWTYADGSAVESFYMPDEDVIFVAVWDGPNHMDVATDADHSCDTCGAENVTEHSYEAEVTAPTCTEGGYTTYTCNCGDSYVADEVAALGHNYEAAVTAPTCTEGGYTTYTCHCGDSYVADETAATGHSYSDQRTEASCTEPGSIEYTCANCGDVYTEEIPATGHSYMDVQTPPTCTEAGYTTHTCHCGDSYVDNTVAALGHNQTTQTVYPTCTEEGSVTVSCDRCGEVVVGTVPATGHSYENGVCGTCGEADPDYVKPVVIPTLTLKAPALEFKDMVKVIAFFTAENIQDVVEMGMVTYSSQVSAASVDTADHVIPGAILEESTGRYFASSQGINAKYLGDTVYLACYAKLTDGSYVYTKVAPYGAVQYATNQLKNSTDMKLKQLVAAMLNYGAAAQNYFGYNTDTLANASLTAEQIALPESYTSDMVQSVPAADAAKQGIFANNKGFSVRKPAVSFEGAFSINYFFTPAYTPVDGITLYYWTEADFAASDVLTVDNATGSIAMTAEADGQYRGDITDIAAKNIAQAIYVAAVYSDGTTTWTSGVLGYSIGAYCASMAKGTDTMADLAKATAVYGYHAKQYFG